MPTVSNFISRAWLRDRKQSRFGQELSTLALAAVFGLLVLPLMIWVGGQGVLGEYIRDPLTGQTGGPVALWLDYLAALGQGQVGYWLACAGPYLIYVALRLLRGLLKL